MTSRTYHDPLHGAITLDFEDPLEALLIRLIDTPDFQRLRRIRQLGVASLTFHGAEGSRFTHSLGAMYISRKALDSLSHRYPALAQYRPLVLCAALLHDLGHGPFSHTAEEIFQIHHEAWTVKIIQESEPIRSLLDQFDPSLALQLEQLYQKTFPVPVVSQLVTSQLDCDRLDYLMRDSYFTGASYGHLDLDRILLAMDYDAESQELVVAQKGLSAIEHYLVVRYFMYAQVYNHPKNIAASWGLKAALNRATILSQQESLRVDATMNAWLTHSHRLSLPQYLAADDGVLTYHLQQWMHCEDEILRDLARRFCDRDLFKVRDISHLEPQAREQYYGFVQQQATALGFDPHYYTSIQVSTMRGYTLYQRGIKVKVGNHLTPISQLSSLVQTLIQPLRRAWLIYPKKLAPSIDLSG